MHVAAAVAVGSVHLRGRDLVDEVVGGVALRL